jgi:hypothetical protein
MTIVQLVALALKVAGTTLTFPAFELKGIPSFDLYLLHGGETSVYHAERRNFQFRVSAQDVADNAVVGNMTFITEDETYQYFFTIESVIPDTTGWVDLIAIFNKSVLL